MKSNRLLQILQKTVSEDEIGKLSAHTLPHISDFNRSVILKMLQDKLLAQEEISEENITALKIFSCIAFHSPDHGGPSSLGTRKDSLPSSRITGATATFFICGITTKSGKLEHQYKLYLICSILNIIQHSLKFRVSLEFFFLSIQTVAIYLHGGGNSCIYVTSSCFQFLSPSIHR